MHALDASSIIYAWDNYPIRQFPGLWEWKATQIASGVLLIPSVAFQEVDEKTPECADWLEANNIKKLSITNTIIQDAKRIKNLIGVVNDNYHSKGVGENDLIIIAAARAHGYHLISDEERQPTLPEVFSKRKIPAVCAMPEVAVPCVNFLEYIKNSDTVFR